MFQHTGDCGERTQLVSLTYALKPAFLQYAHTYHGLEDVLHAFDQLLVDLDGQVTDHLSVLCQVEVGQTVFVLPRCVVFHEGLSTDDKKKRNYFVGLYPGWSAMSEATKTMVN